MPSLSFPESVRTALLLCGLVASSAAVAAAPPLQAFGAATWNELARSPARPLAVVFSTTDCTHCPKVIDEIAAAIRKSRSKARLAVVVMDGAGQEAALRADPHYRNAKALYAFDGDAVALRYQVNPDWRGVTPYVAFIPAAGAVSFHAGHPPPDVLRRFLQP